MSGAIPPLPHYAFMEWCLVKSTGTTLPLPYGIRGVVVQHWATGWMIRGSKFWQGLGIYLHPTASRPALGPTQSPVQWVPGALFLGVKRPGREAAYSPSSSAEVNNAWRCTSWRGA
jgi:hypothetical protein